MTSHFYPRNKDYARKKFGFDDNHFIVAFSGEFSDRKGVLRLTNAAEGLDKVKIALAGKGKLEPNGTNIIHKGLVNPIDMPDFLSAADVFVLPTLSEGCSNSLIEAMACGLPIVSSNLSFNSDILDNSILIDPNSVKDIKNAIVFLRDNVELRKKMSEDSLSKIKHLSLENRALNIKEWIDSIIDK
jgi:teichuronic acid biosynthesis glycosyltransferase TuaC